MSGRDRCSECGSVDAPEGHAFKGEWSGRSWMGWWGDVWEDVGGLEMMLYVEGMGEE